MSSHSEKFFTLVPASLAMLSPHLLRSAEPPAASQFLNRAPTPPMGSNSWDCFATTKTNEDSGPGLPIAVNLTELTGIVKVRSRAPWTGIGHDETEGNFPPVVPYHGAKLHRLTRSTKK